jgi:proteic killer suppression protein
MRYRLIYPESYVRRARKFLRRHPEILTQYRKTLELLQLNPFHPSLRSHALQGPLQGLWSISINICYRIVLQIMVRENEILLINVGKHEEVY